MTLSMRVKEGKEMENDYKWGMSYGYRTAAWNSDCIAFGVVIRKAQIASAYP